jgi:hypothetical protein
MTHGQFIDWSDQMTVLQQRLCPKRGAIRPARLREIVDLHEAGNGDFGCPEFSPIGVLSIQPEGHGQHHEQATP